MKSVQELQNEVNNPDVACSVLLRDAKVLASALKQNEFLEWINKELDGYSEKDKVPDYRVVKGLPKAFNPYRGWVPLVHEDPSIQGPLSARGIGQGIGQLEELQKSSKEFIVTYPPEVEAAIRKGMEISTELHLTIDRSELVAILERVRNVVLDWTVRLHEAGITGESSEISKKELDEVKQITSTYQIGHIENFRGNLGEANDYSPGDLLPKESFWNKFTWYVVIAGLVLIIGNISSGLVLHYLFHIG